MDDFEMKPGPLARALCWLFGHVHDPRRYLSTGRRQVVDGIGRLHVNIVGSCKRCEALVEFGQLHVPHGPWEVVHAPTGVWMRQTLPAVPRHALASWDAEHPDPVRVVAQTHDERVVERDPDPTVELPTLSRSMDTQEAMADSAEDRREAARRGELNDNMLTGGWLDGIGGKIPPG